MGTEIIVCGLNGCGKSTLGKALAESLGYHFFDSEDVYFPENNSDYSYDYPFAREEAERRFLEEKKKHENFVFAAVKWNYTCFDYAVLIEVPKGIRVKRVEDRSFNKFGSRMLAGGDLYEKEKRFLDSVRGRSETTAGEWLRTLRCPVIRVDGTESVDSNVKLIIANMTEINRKELKK